MRIVTPAEAAGILREGKVILVPTETVVGIVASEAGLPRVREIKGREADKPVALLCLTETEAFALASKVPPLARRLAGDYWPGALTLVLDRVGVGTVGVRVPAPSAVRAVLEAYGEPLFATSANLSGKPAPRALDEVDPRVSQAVAVAVAGEPGSGEASAVVDLSDGKAKVLRPAADLTQQRLSAIATR